MKKMTHKNGTELTITEHIITRNNWEYYVTNEKFNDDIVCCLVLGFEDEIGDVSLSEIRPHVISRTKDLEEVMAAPGWSWIE